MGAMSFQRVVFVGLVAFPVLLGACGSSSGGGEASASAVSEPWDSAGGNPFHPAHSYLAEYAIGQLSNDYPEVGLYSTDLITGCNQEIHDLPKQNAELEALRQEVGGNNWAADHPEIMWQHALDAYQSGATNRAYYFVGALLHYVQDMGVPAHGFHVYHQSSPGNWDGFELMAFQDWEPDYSNIDRCDPLYANPVDYVELSADWSRTDWNDSYPGETYRRDYFAGIWATADDSSRAFVKERQGRTATITTWALRSMLAAFAGQTLCQSSADCANAVDPSGTPQSSCCEAYGFSTFVCATQTDADNISTNGGTCN
jgi:hypothetical protein